MSHLDSVPYAVTSVFSYGLGIYQRVSLSESISRPSTPEGMSLASRDAMTRWIALVRNHCVLVRQPENIPEQLLNIPEAYLALEANNEASEKTA